MLKIFSFWMTMSKRSERKEMINMKFTKGLVVGGLLATGLLMMYNDTDMLNKNKMMKKGKKFAKKVGIF